MRLAITSAVTLCVLAAPGGTGEAHGALASVETQCRSTKYGDACSSWIVFEAGPGERNEVSMRLSAEEAVIRESGARLRAGDGCSAVDEHAVACDRRPRGVATLDIYVTLADRNDSLRLEETGCSFANHCDNVWANAGAGADVLMGGTGGDALNGGPGRDELYGGEGRDALGDSDSESALRDDVIDGGPDLDWVRYLERTRAVTIDLRERSAGAIGESDSLVSIEGAVGGLGDDLLLGDGGRNSLSGYHGDDVLRGRGGTDLLEGHRGRDRLVGGAGSDRFDPGLDDGFTAFYASPRERRDTPRDRARDVVQCGDGADNVFGMRPVDRIDASCERLVAPPHEFAMAGELRRPTDKVFRYDWDECGDLRCRRRLRVELAERVGSTPEGTVLRRRRVAREDKTEAGDIGVRLNPLGRRLLARHREFRVRIQVFTRPFGDVDGFVYEVRLDAARDTPDEPPERRGTIRRRWAPDGR